MIADVGDLDPKSLGLHLHRVPVLRDDGQGAEDQAVEGVILPAGQGDPQGLGHLLQRGLSPDLPGTRLHGLDEGLLRFLLPQLAHQLLHQVAEGEDTRHAAVLIQHHGHGSALLPHIAKQYVGLYAFGHKVGGLHRLGQHPLPALVGETEIILGVEDAHHVVRRLPAHRVADVAAGSDGVGPLLHALLHPQDGQVGAVGGDLPGGQVVKLKDILDELLLLVVDGALLRAHVHHHADLFLAHRLLLGVGVDTQQAQNGVGGHGQKPHDGGKEPGDGGDKPRDTQGQGLRLAHGHPLGHQLAENQGKVGQNQGDDHHRRGVQGGGGHPHPQADEPAHQAVGKVFRGKGAAQKAGQGDGHLDGGQKAGGLTGQAGQTHRPPVSRLGQLGQLGVVHGDHGDLRTGKHGVKQDQKHLQQNHKQHGILQCSFLLKYGSKIRRKGAKRHSLLG